MNLKRLVILLLLVALLLFGLSLPATAAPDQQVQFATATPGVDGRIIYVVQEGDTCTRVALLHGISVDQLRAYNSKLDADCTLTIGVALLVGLAGPATGPTTGPSPTPSPPPVTSTPFTGTTEICVLLFDDLNGDALRQETEPPIDGGAISVTNLNGSYSQTRNTTSALDPNTGEIQRTCFSDVPEGEYSITAGVPDNYNPTMTLSSTIKVQAGDRASVDFGAQSKAVTVGESGGSQNGGRGTSPILGIFGALLLLGGVGLGWYAWRMRRPKSKLKASGLLKR